MNQPQVDFYVLPDSGGRSLLACRLAEKAFNSNHRVYLHVAEQSAAAEFDDLLWTFKQNSFVPHAVCPAPAGDNSPVLIGWQEQPAADADVLINMAAQVPEFYTRFARVLEVVDQAPASLVASRQRFKVYRDAGLQPNSHRM